jgi:hypothetical protein
MLTNPNLSEAGTWLEDTLANVVYSELHNRYQLSSEEIAEREVTLFFDKQSDRLVVRVEVAGDYPGFEITVPLLY